MATKKQNSRGISKINKSKKKVVEKINRPMKKKSIHVKEIEKEIKQSPEKSIHEKNAREAIRIAQQSTIDLIRASAKKFVPKKDEDSDDDDNFMEVLVPRRRGRPSKNQRTFKKNSPIYEPEFNGLMEEPVQVDENNTENSAFHKDNEIIDFWTDDDIPMAKGWKDDIIEF